MEAKASRAARIRFVNYKLQIIPRLRPRMMFRIDTLQPIKRNVRIDLRGRNVGVAKNGLHCPEIGPILHHVRCAGVPQHVWTGVASRSETRFPNQLPDPLPGQAAASYTEEQ